MEKLLSFNKTKFRLVLIFFNKSINNYIKKLIFYFCKIKINFFIKFNFFL